MRHVLRRRRRLAEHDDRRLVRTEPQRHSGGLAVHLELRGGRRAAGARIPDLRCTPDGERRVGVSGRAALVVDHEGDVVAGIEAEHAHVGLPRRQNRGSHPGNVTEGSRVGDPNHVGGSDQRGQRGMQVGVMPVGLLRGQPVSRGPEEHDTGIERQAADSCVLKEATPADPVRNSRRTGFLLLIEPLQHGVRNALRGESFQRRFGHNEDALAQNDDFRALHQFTHRPHPIFGGFKLDLRKSHNFRLMSQRCSVKPGGS